jgi:hypothetical protein
MLVLLLSAPDTPVTVTLMVPVVAVLLAVKVSELVPVVLDGLKTAVTPLVNPEATRLTLLLKPFWPETLTVLPALLDRRRLSAESVADSEKEAAPELLVRSLMRCCPAGEPHPVVRSYPLTAEYLPLLPLRISLRSVV